MNPDHDTLTTLPAGYHQEGSTLTIDLLKPFISSNMGSRQRVSHLKLVSGNETGISLSVDGCQLILDLCAYQTGNEQLHYRYRISQQDKHYSQHTITVELSPSEAGFATLVEATVTADYPVDPPSEEENNAPAPSIDNELFEIDQLLSDIDGESGELKDVPEEDTVTLDQSITDAITADDNDWENTLNTDVELIPEHSPAQDENALVDDENTPGVPRLTEPPPEEGTHRPTENEIDAYSFENTDATEDIVLSSPNEQSTVPVFDENPLSDISYQQASEPLLLKESEDNNHMAPEVAETLDFISPEEAETETNTQEFHFSAASISTEGKDSSFSFEPASSDTHHENREETLSYEDLTPEPENPDNNGFDDILNEVEQAVSKADELLDATLSIHAPTQSSPGDTAEQALEAMIEQMPEPLQQDAEAELETLINSLPVEKPNLDQPRPGTSEFLNQSMHKLTAAIPDTVTINSHEPYTFSLEDFASIHRTSTKPIEAIQLMALPASGHLIYNKQSAETGQVISKRDLLTGRLKFVPDDDVSTSEPVFLGYILCGDNQHVKAGDTR